MTIITTPQKWSEMIGDRAVKKEGACCLLKWGSNLSEAALVLTIILGRKKPWKGQWRAWNMEACGTAIPLPVPCCTSCICLIDAAERICCCLWHAHSVHFNTLPVCVSVGIFFSFLFFVYPVLVNILDLQEWMLSFQQRWLHCTCQKISLKY